MSSMKKTKEGVNLKKCLRLKNTGSIFVIAGLLTILVIASYTYILQSSYTQTALETEITRDTASADAVHKLVDRRICKEDFDQIKDQSDEKKQLYKDISSYFNEIRTLNSTQGRFARFTAPCGHFFVSPSAHYALLSAKKYSKKQER